MSERNAAVARALEENRGRLRAFVRSRVPAVDVDDVLQFAAVRAVESAEQLRDLSRLRPWLFQVHRSVIIDRGRKQATQRRYFADEESSPEAASEPAADGVCACSVHQMRELGESYGTILALVVLGDATLPEAAQTLGISVNNATVRLHRARQALKKRMLEHCGVTSMRECYDCRCVYEGCCAA
ncbi:MAG: sigma-70 family RNA polymerase sigma factor [Myxococcota bacterium]